MPVGLSVIGVLFPLAYLLGNAVHDARPGEIQEVLFRWRNLELLGNTLLLATLVLIASTLLALPTSWWVSRTNLPGRQLFDILAVMPLAIPGYLMAYTLQAAGGDYGSLARLTGWTMPRASGLWGSVLALTLYNTPYLYLNLRVAMRQLDPALEEAARSLGQGFYRRCWGVVLPQLRPALCAGGLLVILHVIGDFGVVSLMRYETYTYALYQSYAYGELGAAAWLAMMLVFLALVLLALEFRFLRQLRLDPVGSAPPRDLPRTPLSTRSKCIGLGFLSGTALLALGVPLLTIGYWAWQAGLEGRLQATLPVLWDTVWVALLAAVLTTVLAIPVGLLGQRARSLRLGWLEQSAYLGYAIPGLAFALGLVITTLRRAPDLYQTAAVLIYAYVLHFLAEAVGPIRGALATASPRLNEASRALGLGRFQTFFRVTLPLLRPGLLSAVALVFLATIKELPLTFILAPRNFSTLAKQVWDYTNDADFAGAALPAILIVLCSATLVSLLFVVDQARSNR